MTTDRALDILAMSEQARWREGIEPEDVSKAVETIREANKELEQDIVPFDLELYEAGLMSMPKEMIKVIDKIRAEIERLHYHPKLDFIKNDKVVEMALEIIDKYKAESEGKE